MTNSAHPSVVGNEPQRACVRSGGVRLVVGVVVVGGSSAFESPVDFVGIWVSPFAHAVFESREEHDRDRVGSGWGDGADDDFGVGGDEWGLRRYWCSDYFHRVCIGARHETDRSTLRARDNVYDSIICLIDN